MPSATAHDLTIARDIARRLREKLGSDLTQVLLFGSRAKGIPKPYSDYDLLLVVKHRDRDTVEGAYDETTDFEIEHHVDISLKVYSEVDFRRKMKMGTPFMRSIRETGIPL
jgi:predicted nucleotidyltransferase